MYSKFQFASKYIRYYLTASNGKGHGIHSPFVFEFVKDILNDKRDYYAYDKIENLRKELLDDQTLVDVNDFGAGPVVKQTYQRSIADIAARSPVPAKLGQLLFRIANYYQPKTMIELGTSLGLSGAYLAFGNTAAKLMTIEGSPAIASIAERNFEKLGVKNINVIKGNFDEQLPLVIGHQPAPDLVYIDGNHRKGPVLQYFNMFMGHIGEPSIIIFDDIHWSKDMEEAWAEIKDDPRVLMSVDLFFFGLVFFRKEFKIKQQFTIRLRNY